MVHRKLASIKRFTTTKLALGLLSASVMALVGMTSAASAVSAHSHSDGRTGYGGGTNVSIDLDVKGDNNVINIVINFLFG